jgi:hypothetical protein
MNEQTFQGFLLKSDLRSAHAKAINDAGMVVGELSFARMESGSRRCSASAARTDSKSFRHRSPDATRSRWR